MQDIATKVEGSQLTPEEFNQIPSELENLITSSGQTLSKNNVNQAATAVAIYAGLGDFYSTSGTADAIILSPVGNMKAPLRYYNGLRVRFIASADNTGIVNIAIQNLSSVSLLSNKGEPLNAGELVTGQEYSATFDGTNFKLFASGSGGGGGLEIGDIGIAPFGIDETQNKRRYLNGQVINQAQFASFTAKLKSAIELYPNLATTEENWQAEIITSVLDQCGKFVIDDVAGTIRLPKVVNINGLQDLAVLGGIKAESLPNIKGRIGAVASAGASTLTGAFSGGYSSSGGTINNNGDPDYNVNFNASLSSSTYRDNAPVQQEAVQYPYFIQVATGVEESIDVSREIELSNPFSLLDYKYSEYELSNASWLLSNGQWNSGAVYQSVYDLLLQELNGTSSKLPYAEHIYKIGDIIDNNGILSNFSASNYAMFPQELVSFSTLSFVIKFKAINFSNYGNILAPYYDYNGFQVGFEADGRIIFRVGNGSSWSVNITSSSAISVNTDYYVRITYANSSYSVDISIDKETWTNYITASSSQIPQGRMCLGQGFVGSGHTQYFLNGTIDLNESYININSERWWTGRRKIITIAGDYTDEDYRLNTTDTTFRLPLKVALASGNKVAGNNGLINIRLLGDATDRTLYGKADGDHAILYGITDGTGMTQIMLSPDPLKSGIETSANGLYLYFYVGEVVQDANLINAGQMSTLVSQLRECHVVIETYQNGTSWYRIYSDGWCEQGGKALITGGTSQVQTQVSLIKAYSSSNYQVLTQSLNTGNTCWDRVISQTTSSFNVLCDYSNATYTPNHYIYWQACGYTA